MVLIGVNCKQNTTIWEMLSILQYKTTTFDAFWCYQHFSTKPALLMHFGGYLWTFPQLWCFICNLHGGAGEGVLTPAQRRRACRPQSLSLTSSRICKSRPSECMKRRAWSECTMRVVDQVFRLVGTLTSIFLNRGRDLGRGKWRASVLTVSDMVTINATQFSTV
jgi:hypothetical protein